MILGDSLMKFQNTNLYKSFLFIYNNIQRISRQLDQDNITVYAAQASFFVTLSAMPFLSLLISIVSFFTPADVQGLFDGYTFSANAMNFLGTLFTDLQTAPKISLLSFSAIVTLWSASRGMSAIRKGIETVYDSKSSRGFIFHRLRSLISTIMLIVLVVATVVLLLFGDFIGNMIGNFKITDIILQWRTPFLLLFICIVCTTVYTSAAKRSTSIRSTIYSQLPGAVFASIGWILFSYCYSIYIRYFPNASYIYGSLAAICLFMLWLYFCMIILLLGAELNKMYSARKKKKVPHIISYKKM